MSLPPMPGFAEFEGRWGPNAQLAWHTIAFEETRGIPHKWMNVMDHALLEEISGHPPGAYRREPERVYRDCQLAMGASFCDQWIPRNPLTMGERGFEHGAERRATTGAERIERDGIMIDSPEAVIEHMERFLFPQYEKEIAAFDAENLTEVWKRIEQEVEVQRLFGPKMLKAPYGGHFPHLDYYGYGYECYFSAYALYPEVMERCFRLQGERGRLLNARTARAIEAGGLPRMVRLDHDMADSRGTLASIGSLDKLWFLHFARAVEPFVKAGIRLVWHCDGNLMQMVPRLIEAGIGGFQGFQYEDGMDYERICKMTDREGGPLMIWGGVSVTTTLPLGTREDVIRQLKWLVECGPRRGLVLGVSSSIVPGTSRENVRTLIQGLKHYQERGRS